MFNSYESLLKIFALNFLSFLNDCNTTEPTLPPDNEKPIFILAIDDTSCTEAWLQLTTKDLDLPAQLTLKQYNPTGDSLSKIFVLNTQDSVLYIDSLFPNQNYNFHATMQQSNNASNKLVLQHLTQHQPQLYLADLGVWQHSSSVLYDVAIIDENNIWAVGEIYMNDSLGQSLPDAYNAVHWNGQ